MKRCYKECGILFVILLIIFASFRYNDLKYIIFYEHSLINNLINSEGMNFYQFCMQQYELYGYDSGACFALWGMPMYIILGLWGIPLYVISSIADISVYELIKNMWAVLYGKSILIVFLIAVFVVMLKIFENFRHKNINKIEIMLLFFSSYLMVAPVFIQGQCDIIEIFFALLGIYFLIVKKNSLLFVLSFIVAVSLKQFSILLFIPIVLLTEKKVGKIVLKIGSVLVLPITNKLIWGGPIDNTINVANVEMILTNKLPLLNGDIPIFLVIYALICLWAYLYAQQDEEKINDAILFVGIAVYGAVNVFSNQIYRCIWILPFLVLIVGVIRNRNYVKIIALETIIEACYAFYQICKYYWCFDINNCQYMLPDKMVGETVTNPIITVLGITSRFSAMHLDAIIGAIMIALIIVIVYIVLRYKDKEIMIPFLDKYTIIDVIRIRMILIAGVGAIPIILYGLNAILVS